ncbi:MAG: hydroxyacid dehydrogenase [Synergistetes bacterium]|nr:hydroxyacid dehydrogenase [Synergistota bacterium]
MKRFKVIITGPKIAEEGMQMLEKECVVVYLEPYPTVVDLMKAVREEVADALLVRTGRITSEVIEASPNLRVIAKHGTGVDNIDVAAATARGIPVLIATFANYESVAEHALALMFALARGIPWLDSRIRKGYWDKMDYKGEELFGKTLGVIGFGRIGRRLRELVKPLEMKVLVYDPFLEPMDFPMDVIRVDKLDTLLESSDIVSIHCPLTEKTKHLIGERELKLMKNTAWLINTARGKIVDEKALIEALKLGEIGGAGIDAFYSEPPDSGSVLFNMERVVMTPHVGGVTRQSLVRMGETSAKNVLDILKGIKPDARYIVNPEIYK